MFDVLICTAVNDILQTRVILLKVSICAQKPKICKMDNLFLLENWPKSVLKDMTVYAFTFHCTGFVSKKGVNDDFQNLGSKLRLI